MKTPVELLGQIWETITDLAEEFYDDPLYAFLAYLAICGLAVNVKGLYNLIEWVFIHWSHS